MRLLLTTDTVGGVWTFSQELTRGLLATGHSVALVSFGRLPTADQQAWFEHLLREWRDEFLYVPSDIPLEWMQQNQSAYEDGTELLQRVAHGVQPDLLISSQFCYGRLELAIPRLVVAHSDVLSWAAACRKERYLESSPWLDRYEAMVAAGLGAASAVIAPTRWMLEALGSHFPLPSQQYVVPNGRTLPAAISTAERKLQAITAGRIWDEAKNIRLLEDVCSPMPILVAGEEEAPFRSHPPSPLHITFLGKLDEAALLARFWQSAIYICCSKYEPFGLAPLEAALCGCAVLANDIPSLREVWGDAALYFHDAASLSHLLGTLSRSPSTLLAAQDRSFARAREYSASRMVEGYAAALASAMERAGAPAYV